MIVLRRRFLRLGTEDGLSIIETLAAILLFGIITLGVAPLFMTGLRSSLASRFETQAKNLAQERLEAMRNLPFYAASTATTLPATCAEPSQNTSGCDYRDLLDTYFRSAIKLAPATPPNPPTVPGHGGYVGDQSRRSADETAAGLVPPYYRYVPGPDPQFEQGRFSQVIATQFLDASRTVATPRTTYNTQDPAHDAPPSRLVSTTIITRWTVGTRARKYVTFSQIAEGTAEETAVTLAAEATALSVRSQLDATTAIEALAGLSNSRGSVAGGTTASTYGQGGYAAFVPGSRVDGKYGTASAPPVANSVGGNAGPVSLEAAGEDDRLNRTYAYLNSTDVSSLSVGITPGQPSVPASGAGPANTSKGSLRPATTAEAVDFAFDNGNPDPVFTATGMPQPPDYKRPFVSIESPTTADSAKGETYLTSKRGAGHFARAGALAGTQDVRIMPTTFAPDGLVIVRLNSASVRCNATGPAGTAQADTAFDGYIKYFKLGEDGALPGYVTLAFSKAENGPATVMPPFYPEIAATPVFAGVGDCSSPESCVVPPRTLGEYIKSWSVLENPTTATGPQGTAASASLDGIVRVVTQNTRGSVAVPDDGSAIEVRLGILSCSAEDKRP